jgi:hypothetical protein
MIDAEKKRATALYADLPPDFFEDGDLSGLPIFKLRHSKAKTKRKDKNNHLKAPDVQRRRQSITSTSVPIELEFDDENAKLEIKAFNEAFKILMKECESRKAVRIKHKAIKVKAKNRILAVWAFRKKQQEIKKIDLIQKENAERKMGIYSSKKPSSYNNEENEEKDEEKHEGDDENISTRDSGNGGSNSSETGAENSATKDNKKNSNAPEKRTTEIVNLQSRLDLKKKQQKPGNKYYNVSMLNEAHSETRKWKDAQQHLVRLKEQQIKRNPVNTDIVEEKKKRKIPKLKDVVKTVMRMNAVNNAFKIKSKTSRASEDSKDANIETETNKFEVEGIQYLFL